MRSKELDGDLTQYTANFLTDHTVEMEIQVTVIERHLVEAGIPPGSLVSPIIFAIDTSGSITQVEETVCRAEGLSFVDAIGWVVTDNDVDQVIRKQSVLHQSDHRLGRTT